MREVVICRGHPNVMATHNTTIEITKEPELTPAGDCIVGVGADKGMLELPEKFKAALRAGNGVQVTLECGGVTDTVNAKGSLELTLDHPTDMVIRKSEYVCGRTLAIGADKAAVDLKRELIEKLKEGLELRVVLAL